MWWCWERTMEETELRTVTTSWDYMGDVAAASFWGNVPQLLLPNPTFLAATPIPWRLPLTPCPMQEKVHLTNHFLGLVFSQEQMTGEENRIFDITLWRNGMEDAFLYSSVFIEWPTLSQLKCKGVLCKLKTSETRVRLTLIFAPIPALL